MDNDFYRPTGKVKDTNRTYVPDMYRQVAAEMRAEEGGQHTDESPHVVKLQKRPLIGVLYSISACAEGELFPVYVGRNTIGSDLSCDICLRETSVSAQHGLLLARKQPDAMGKEYIHVILSDNNSMYGTSVNDERLIGDRVTCADGDVLTIGQNYVLVLSLFNALDKLSVAYAFDRIPEHKKEEPRPVQPQPLPMPNIIATPTSRQNDDEHSTNTTLDEVKEEASVDFYLPSKQKNQDHYNNKTIIL